MKLQYLAGESLWGLKHKLKIDSKNFNVPTFQGFEFFSPIDIDRNQSGSEHSNILVYFDEKEDIVGVIKLINTKHQGRAAVGISYIDVRNDRQHNKVAISMITALRDYFPVQAILVLSPEIKMGKQAGLKEKIKSIFAGRKIVMSR